MNTFNDCNFENATFNTARVVNKTTVVNNMNVAGDEPTATEPLVPVLLISGIVGLVVGPIAGYLAWTLALDVWGLPWDSLGFWLGGLVSLFLAGVAALFTLTGVFFTLPVTGPFLIIAACSLWGDQMYGNTRNGLLAVATVWIVILLGYAISKIPTNHRQPAYAKVPDPEL